MAGGTYRGTAFAQNSIADFYGWLQLCCLCYRSLFIHISFFIREIQAGQELFQLGMFIIPIFSPEKLAHFKAE